MFYDAQNIRPWELLNKAIPNSSLEEFEFGLPLMRKSDASKDRLIEGVASTPARDLQDEEVVQKGLDLSYFLKHGYFNNDHQPGFANKVGQPTKAEIKRIKDRSNKSVLGLWVEGYIWPKGVHKVADDIWELGEALEAAGSNRRLGFSIQGKVLKRDGRKIVKAWVQDVAITPSPINTKTWLHLVKEMEKSMCTSEDIQDLRKSISAKCFQDTIYEASDVFYKSEKALNTTSARPITPQSLEEKQKLALNLVSADDSEINKAVSVTYSLLKDRGYPDGMARLVACATVARTLMV